MTMPNTIGSSRRPLPSESPADVLEVLRQCEEQAEHREREERHQIVPSEPDRPEQGQVHSDCPPRAVIRRSTSTNRASRTRPARWWPALPGCPAFLARLDAPVRHRDQAALEISTPDTSMDGRFAERDSGSRKQTATSAMTTTGTLIRKTEPHRSGRAGSRPGSADREAQIVAADMIAIALRRSSWANIVGAPTATSGRSPTRPRRAVPAPPISSPVEVANAHNAEAAPNSTSATSSTACARSGHRAARRAGSSPR